MEPLSAVEARVLGCLLEKQLATPQYYPLTLNALVLACNQSSNRDPVTDYAEADVAGALAALRDKGLARVILASGSRAPKYRHVLDEAWALDPQHRAVLAMLLLRGPQTVGELRARTERLATFADVGEVEEVLGLLASREEPLGHQLERRAGQKEARFCHLLGGTEPDEAPAGNRPPGLTDRVAALEQEVGALRAELAEMRALFE